MNEVIASLISGFGGAIIGAIIGAVGSYYGSKKIMAAQFKHEEKKAKDREKEKERTLVNIVSKVLKQEIINNKKEIVDTNSFKLLKEEIDKIKVQERAQQFRWGDSLSEKISVKNYEELKWELMKYSDNDILSKIIDAYQIIYFFKRGFELKNLDSNEIKKISSIDKKIEDILKNLN